MDILELVVNRVKLSKLPNDKDYISLGFEGLRNNQPQKKDNMEF